MPKYREGDRVRIHQEPGYPLDERHRYLHGAKGVIRVVLLGERAGEYVVESGGSLYHLRENNLIPEWTKELQMVYIVEGYNRGSAHKRFSEEFRFPPTKEKLLKLMDEWDVTYVKIHQLYRKVTGD